MFPCRFDRFGLVSSVAFEFSLFHSFIEITAILIAESFVSSIHFQRKECSRAENGISLQRSNGPGCSSHNLVPGWCLFFLDGKTADTVLDSGRLIEASGLALRWFCLKIKSKYCYFAGFIIAGALKDRRSPLDTFLNVSLWE
jgi:uncharacterized protein YcnI